MSIKRELERIAGFMPMLAAVAVALAFTHPTPAGAACPNELLRVGFSASLPDCRAYELVTPPDANGRLFIDLRPTIAYDRFPTELASPSGGSVVFMTYGTPVSSPGGANGVWDIYESVRTDVGWRVARRLSPSGPEGVIPQAGGVSGDHRYAFTMVGPLQFLSGGSLAEEGLSDYLSKPDGSFELTGVGSLGSDRLAQGRYISPGGGHVIFSTGSELSGSYICFEAACEAQQLEPDAAPDGTGAIYDRLPDGPTLVVSLLPGNIPAAAGEDAAYQGASKDGSSVAFKINGSLYVRLTEAQQTLKATEAAAIFAGLSADGRYLFYVAAGDIYRFDTISTETDQVNASADAEVVTASDDGSHVYFISESQLDGPEGTAGQPNMYVWNGGSPKYVATVLPSDLDHTSGDLSATSGLTTWTSRVVTPDRSAERGVGPGASSTRLTPDGTVLAFESRAQLTTAPTAGQTAIYRYDDRDHSLRCVSCSPDHAPSADAQFQNLKIAQPPIVIHNLSADGSRVFFETAGALSERDTNGINDIYEWQEWGADSSVDLISSGVSVDYPSLDPELGFQPLPNTLLGITPSGGDVVFGSLDELVPGAGTGGVPAIYDARVGGGFPLPSSPREECDGEACRGAAASAPQLSAPLSERTRPGNVKPQRRKCRRHSKKASQSKKRRHCKKQRQRPPRSRRSRGLPAARHSAVPAGGDQAAESPATGSAVATVSNNQTSSSSTAVTTATDFDSFGIKSFGASVSSPAAAAHADFTTEFALNFQSVGGQVLANARVEDILVDLSPGLVGNPQAFPRCDTGHFLAFGNCPTDSQVGITEVLPAGFPEMVEPIYNLAPPHPEREIARLGFFAGIYPIYIDVSLRTAGDYGVRATIRDATGLAPLLKAKTTLWGDPADPSHDEQRLTTVEAINCITGTACKAPGGSRPSGIENPKAFMTNPSACQEGSAGLSVTSYQLPGKVFTASAPMAPIVNCQGLRFEPSLEVQPTSRRAGAPTGLHASVRIPQHEGPDELGSSTMRDAKVTLPEGMTISASAAAGLEACPDGQLHLHEEANAQCPDASRLGTATVVSPALSRPLHGWLYQRTPSPGHQFGLWLVVDEMGLHLKLPGEVSGAPDTGRLTAHFDDLPQLPVEEVALDFRGGPRAPLKNPDTCGTHFAAFDFKPWSNDPSVTGQALVVIDEGCGTGFSPKLRAGVTRPKAGRYSPLIVDLTREDGEDNLRSFDLELPQGELAKLRGVPLCPDAVSPTGACPDDSRIGSVTVAAGAGPQPLWIPQPGRPATAVYLAGPYQGAPYSIIAKVPAQAGPFDLGLVMVRSGLFVDSETGRANVKTQLPQVLEGARVLYRRIHVVIDRPRFAINPTDCRPMAAQATITGAHGASGKSSSRFQVGGCKRLKFGPKLSLGLRGESDRGAFPALTAVLKTNKDDANIGRVSVALPHSEFLAQQHIGTICTRVRFQAEDCPRRAIYGYAKAWTPLLSRPIEGPVYLRSSDNPLPDLVAALDGQIDIDLVGRIDSHNGGIRTTFESVPDAPVTKFVLKMRGGKDGLLQNSQNICRGRHRAGVQMSAQNGRRMSSDPLLKVPCTKR